MGRTLEWRPTNPLQVTVDQEVRVLVKGNFDRAGPFESRHHDVVRRRMGTDVAAYPRQPPGRNLNSGRERLQGTPERGDRVRRASKILLGSCVVSVQTVRAIRDGSRRVIHPRTAAAIMNTRASVAAGTLMWQADRYRTRERLRRLVEEEYPREWFRDLVGEHAVRLIRLSHFRP